MRVFPRISLLQIPRFWAPAVGIRVLRTSQAGESFLFSERFRCEKHRLNGLTVAAFSLACAGGNLCAKGAVNLLLEIRYVRSSVLLKAVDTVSDP